MFKRVLVMALAGLPLLAQAQVAEAVAVPAKLKAMILVDNRAGKQHNEQVLRFEDVVTANMDDDVLSIISREDVVMGQRVYDGEAPAASTADPQNNAAFLARLRSDLFRAIDKAPSGTAVTEEDWKTLRNSSALNMARNVGADLILAVTIASVNKETRNFQGSGIATKTTTWTLRGSYKLLELATGGTVVTGEVKADNSIRETSNITIDLGDVCAALMEKGATKLASEITSKAAKIKAAELAMAQEVRILCEVQDLQGKDLTFPEFKYSEDGTVTTTDQNFNVQALATVEIDGFLVGSTPCAVKIIPGLHKIRVSAPGFVDYSANMRVAGEMKALTIPLQMSDVGLQRWQAVRANVMELSANKKILEAALEKDRKLTPAQIEYIQGQAEMYRNSHFRLEGMPQTVVNGGGGFGGGFFSLLNMGLDLNPKK